MDPSLPKRTLLGLQDLSSSQELGNSKMVVSIVDGGYGILEMIGQGYGRQVEMGPAPVSSGPVTCLAFKSSERSQHSAAQKQ